MLPIGNGANANSLHRSRAGHQPEPTVLSASQSPLRPDLQSMNNHREAKLLSPTHSQDSRHPVLCSRHKGTETHRRLHLLSQVTRLLRAGPLSVLGDPGKPHIRDLPSLFLEVTARLFWVPRVSKASQARWTRVLRQEQLGSRRAGADGSPRFPTQSWSADPPAPRSVGNKASNRGDARGQVSS